RDLHEHVLARLEGLLDARQLAVEVGDVVVDLARVEDAVAALADVDEGRLHAGQHVLHAAQVDVADGGGVGGAGDVVLDEVALLEHGDLGALRADADEHLPRRALVDGAARLLADASQGPPAAPPRSRGDGAPAGGPPAAAGAGLQAGGLV